MKIKIISLITVLGLSYSLNAVTLEARFSSVGPVAFAPAGIVAHDGTFDVFDSGSSASAELRTLAELGSPASLLGTAPSSANTIALFGQVTGGAGPIGVGETTASNFTVDAGNNYITLASMLLPSSDYFIGNGNPLAWDISSLLTGNVGDTITFNISRVYDAGTEVNDFATSPGGPLVGAPAGVATDNVAENGVVTLVSGADPFGSFLNAGSFDTTSIDFTGGNVASLTFTVVPEPTSGALVGLAGLTLLARRKR